MGAILLSCVDIGVAAAAQVYVVRFNTLGSPVFAEAPCTYLSYRDELVFRNAGSGNATVRLLGVSNGTAQTPQDLTVAPGQTRSTEGDASAVAASWAPTSQPLLWVDQLDVPDSVQIVSRLLVPAYPTAFCEGGVEAARRTYAGIPMPVIRGLTAAGVPKVHLATDIGGDAACSTRVRSRRQQRLSSGVDVTTFLSQAVQSRSPPTASSSSTGFPLPQRVVRRSAPPRTKPMWW
jgi:hypothetical protein